MTIKEYQENAGYRVALEDFLSTTPGREFISVLKTTRRQLTADRTISEACRCGRHDSFEALDELLVAAMTPPPVRRPPMSEKGGAVTAPHKAKLPN